MRFVITLYMDKKDYLQGDSQIGDEEECDEGDDEGWRGLDKE